eukprot:m.158852 g.158852  ORF g.158852 m.158852 type:complete len:522 (-) comp14511_c0_seq1:1504-3069(-)
MSGRRPSRPAPPPPANGPRGQPGADGPATHAYAEIEPDSPNAQRRQDSINGTGGTGSGMSGTGSPGAAGGRSPSSARRAAPPPRPPPPTITDTSTPEGRHRGSINRGGQRSDGSQPGASAAAKAREAGAAQAGSRPDPAALQAAAAAHLADHGARAAAVLRDGPPQQQLRAVRVPRPANPRQPLGIHLKIDPDPANRGVGSIVVVKAVTPGGHTASVISQSNLLMPGDRLALINGVDLRSVHYTNVLGMLSGEHDITFHVDDSLHTPRPRGHQYGSLAAPWTGPLASNPQRTSSAAAAAAGAGARTTAPARTASGGTLGPPGNPFGPGTSTSGGRGGGRNPDAPPSYEEALHNPTSAGSDPASGGLSGIGHTDSPSGSGARAHGPCQVQASGGAQGHAGAGCVEVITRAPPQPGSVFEVVVTRRGFPSLAIPPLGLQLHVNHQAPAAAGPRGSAMVASVTVVSIRPDGAMAAAAARGAVQVGDFIVAVGGVPVAALTEDTFFGMLKVAELRLGVSRPVRSI